jgi:BioD-like phosphotransacetylase family protein
MKKIFISATNQNDGKTTVALGLIANLNKRFKAIGFIKPVGQRYLVEEHGFKIDEDSILIEDALKTCGIKCDIRDTSPVAVEKGFTENYINDPKPKQITRHISEAFKRIAKSHNLVIIEGTGHAGVGSVFDHSNAQVAKQLGSGVIIVSSGGIGRPIDEICLNKALFEKEGVKLLGVIVNKVIPDKFDKINNLIRRGLKRKGIEVLGVIPYNPMLSYPTINQLLEETDYKLLYADPDNCPDNRVAKIVVGAMQIKDAKQYIIDQSLLITPGDREDMIKLALESHRQGSRVSGIILTGGIVPNKRLVSSLEKAYIPLLSSKKDTYKVAATVSDLTVKIRPNDREKIDTVKQLINNYVNLDSIINRI